MTAITYRTYRDGDDDAIVALYNSIFPKAKTLAQWRWEYRSNPIGRMDIVVAFHGDQLVAHSAGIPLVLSHEGRPVKTSRIQNVFVHADHRGRGIFTETLVRLTEHLAAHDVDFVLTFPNANSLAGFLGTGAYQHVFDIFQFRFD